jgi:hypothetical protein
MMCTRVAAHTLYENASPYHLQEPGGMINMLTCTYEQYDARRAKVSGNHFVPAERYTIKLEAAQCQLSYDLPRWHERPDSP